MHLIDILASGSIRVFPKVSSKKRLFCDLADVAHANFDLNQELAFNALQERENLGPTAVGGGVALPHARLPGLEAVHGVFIRLEAPLDFDAMDRKPVDLIFALFAPEGVGVAHLKALAVVSRTLRDQELCEKLRANTDPAILYAILTEAQASEAA